VNAALITNPNGSVNWKVDLPTARNDTRQTKYYFRAKAYDNQGNSTRSANIIFFIDRTAPVIEVINPRPTTYTPSQITGANGTISDPISGRIVEAHAVLTRVGDPTTTGDDTFLGPGDAFSGPYDPSIHNRPITINADGTFNFPFPTLDPDRYAFKVFATDAAGNSGASAKVSFIVKAPEPEPTPVPDEFEVGKEYRISIPYMDAAAPDSTTTPTQAFSRPPVAAGGAENYRLLRLDSANNLYVPLDNNSILRRGEGYVLRPVERGTTILRPSMDPTRKPTDATQFEITLHRSPSAPSGDVTNGYNLIGYPFNPATHPPVDWFNGNFVTVIGPDGHVFNSVTEASTGTGRVMTDELLRYDPDTNTYVQDTLLRPFKGYYVRALVDGVRIVMKAAP
jgi:hypothetical protein